jgi:hypothetical protein
MIARTKPAAAVKMLAAILMPVGTVLLVPSPQTL